MYYQPELETMPREELDALQLERLQKLVAYVYERIPFYRESFDEAGVKPEDIKSLDDLRKFPFTVKQDLRDAYPFGMFAVPRSEVARIHCSSGTTGTATVVGYTEKDLEVWGRLLRSLPLCSRLRPRCRAASCLWLWFVHGWSWRSPGW